MARAKEYRDFLLVGICMILVVNLFMFHSFHSSSYMDNIDTVGRDWVAVTDRNVIRCQNLDLLTRWKEYHKPLKKSEQALWDSMNCAKILDDHHSQTVLSSSRGRTGRWCMHAKETYGIVPNTDWGTAPEGQQRTWDAYDCNCYFDRSCFHSLIKSRAPAVHESTTAEGVMTAVKMRKPEEMLRPSGQQPVVAIVLGATSKKLRFPTLEQNPLFVHLLPSVEKTAEPGFEYWVMVGYDTGDLFYDNDAILPSLRKWFQRNVAKPLARDGVTAKIAFMQFTNVLLKPGPVFNFVAAAAFQDGADYVFRVNDDTEIVTVGWAHEMSSHLSEMSPQNLGVVGPSGRGDASSTRLMITHDFVHKTHMRIFDQYYPSVLSDWWMDDWISSVYPDGNAQKLRNVVVEHHTEVVANVHGTNPGEPVRYDVDPSHKNWLYWSVEQGNKKIVKFMAENCDRSTCRGEEEPKHRENDTVQDIFENNEVSEEERKLYGRTDVNSSRRWEEREEAEDEAYEEWEQENDDGDDDWRSKDQKMDPEDTIMGDKDKKDFAKETGSNLGAAAAEMFLRDIARGVYDKKEEKGGRARLGPEKKDSRKSFGEGGASLEKGAKSLGVETYWHAKWGDNSMLGSEGNGITTYGTKKDLEGGEIRDSRIEKKEASVGAWGR